MNPNELRELADRMRRHALSQQEADAASAYLREQADRQEKAEPIAWRITDPEQALGGGQWITDDAKEAYEAGCVVEPLYLQSVPTGYWLAPMELTGEMLDAGGHVNSEWLNDNAPIGEVRYAMPMPGVWKAMRDACIAASPAAPVEVPQQWTGIARAEQIADEASEDYVFEGDAGFYTPTDGERFMLLDFVMGLLADDDFVSAIRDAAPAAPAPADVVEALREAKEALDNLIDTGVAVKEALDADIPRGDPVHPQSSRLTWPLSVATGALRTARAALAAPAPDVVEALRLPNLKGFIHPDGWEILDEPALVDGKYRALVNLNGALAVVELKISAALAAADQPRQPMAEGYGNAATERYYGITAPQKGEPKCD